MNALVHGSDEEKESIITHIAFTNNAHMDFVEKLKDLITKETVNIDSLLLAYGALADSTSSRVQQRIVLFLKRRLIQQMESNDTTNTVHLLHALGNTGSKLIVNLLMDYLMRGNSVEIQLAAVGAMRKLTAQQSVQEAFVLPFWNPTHRNASLKQLQRRYLLGRSTHMSWECTLMRTHDSSMLW